MQAVIALVIIGTTIWIGFDASGRDWTQNRFCNATWKWVVGCLLLWIVAFPAYLVQRGRVPAKA
jgi:hypothetical protein